MPTVPGALPSPANSSLSSTLGRWPQEIRSEHTQGSTRHVFHEPRSGKEGGKAGGREGRREQAWGASPLPLPCPAERVLCQARGQSLLGEAVVEGGAQQVVEQQDGPAPQLQPLPPGQALPVAQEAQAGGGDKVRASDSRGRGPACPREARPAAQSRTEGMGPPGRPSSPGHIHDTGQEPGCPRPLTPEAQAEHCRPRR